MKRLAVLLPALLLVVSCAACGPSPRPEVSPNPSPEPWPEDWQAGYHRILADWSVLEVCGNLSYLPQYFGDAYGFDSYFLCDVDSDGTPELFLDSSTMGLTAVCCYDAGPVGVFYDRFDVNKQTGELIVAGHWHGAGGIGTLWDNEWRAWKLCGTDWELSMSIDCFEAKWLGTEENRYDIHDPETGEDKRFMAASSPEYDALYDVHVVPCIPFSQFQLYTLEDLSGLETVQ